MTGSQRLPPLREGLDGLDQINKRFQADADDVSPQGGRRQLQIALDRQVVEKVCDDCGIKFTVVRGSVFDGGEPFGLYLIAMHGHSSQGRLAHLAIAVQDRMQSNARPLAVAMLVSDTGEKFALSLVDWDCSPWKDQTYLGIMLDRDAANASPSKQLVFHIADHVVMDLPEMQKYFA